MRKNKITKVYELKTKGYNKLLKKLKKLRLAFFKIKEAKQQAGL